jgi:hypothetical protein
MTGRGLGSEHLHRRGHGRRTRCMPDVLLTEDERLGLQRPPGWPTPLLCLDCGVLWPDEPGWPHQGPTTGIGRRS